LRKIVGEGLTKINVAIAGIGNCASALIQGVNFYKDMSSEEKIPGLLHVNFGGYHPSDIKFVAAFDIDARKVGKDLSKAIKMKPNNTRNFSEVPNLGVTVRRGPIMDGLGKYLTPVVKVDKTSVESDVVKVLNESEAEILLNYLPVGSEKASKWYAEQALKAGCALINCIPVFIASDDAWQNKFRAAGLPLAGDDVMSQIGATVLHKTLAKLLVDRGVDIDESYQLNIGGDTDFLNMLEQERLRSKRISKTSAVRAMIPYDVPLRIGPSDYVEFLDNKKICYIRIKGKYFGDTPASIEAKLDIWDAPNSGGVIIDAIRAVKLALDRNISGTLTSISSYAFKHPPKQLPASIAKDWVEEFILGKRER
jgi:myo-inositol-1-phosphate synthase